jgi:hypothetical protein
MPAPGWLLIVCIDSRSLVQGVNQSVKKKPTSGFPRIRRARDLAGFRPAGRVVLTCRSFAIAFGLAIWPMFLKAGPGLFAPDFIF